VSRARLERLARDERSQAMAAKSCRKVHQWDLLLAPQAKRAVQRALKNEALALLSSFL